MRDDDVIEIATLLRDETLRRGEGWGTLSPSEYDEVKVDIQVDFFFPTGFTVSQLAAVLDETTFAMYVALVATESLESGSEPRDIVDRLLNDDLSIVWTLDFLEVGSLNVRATIKRVGKWSSERGAPTKWALGLVGGVVTLTSIPFAIPIWGASMALGGVLAGTEWYANKGLREKDKNVGEEKGIAPPAPNVSASIVPAS